MGQTTFTRLSEGWNAEPNAPESSVIVDAGDVVLAFDLNCFQFPQFHEGQRGQLRFLRAWRYRLGTPNDEGWYLGQCRFSGIAPAWGEFYEVAGDLRLGRCRNDWVHISREPSARERHFLFYLRDETFECDAEDYVLDLG